MRPQQAVILCGGQGTRLRPLTLTTPKPMVCIGTRPFLYYLLEQLSETGIRKFLLLTGYLSDLVEEYFGDGSQFGWSIKYSRGPIDWNTGYRIYKAQAHIESHFMLLYGDNFALPNFSDYLDSHLISQKALSLLISPKTPGNISISNNPTVTRYTTDRSHATCDYVELGYMFVNRDPFLKQLNLNPPIPELNLSTVIKQLSDNLNINSYSVDFYHSISDPKRLSITKDFLRPKKIILIDRDGVINHKADPGQYITSWSQFKFIESTIDAMALLSSSGFSFIIITNQACIARGILTVEGLQEIHDQMLHYLRLKGIKVLDLYHCPHHWDDECYCRKPKPGMFHTASKDHHLRLDKTIYIGDDVRDIEAAYSAGCNSIFLSPDRNSVLDHGDLQPDHRSYNLNDSIPFIESFYSSGQ